MENSHDSSNGALIMFAISLAIIAGMYMTPFPVLLALFLAFFALLPVILPLMMVLIVILLFVLVIKK